MVKNPPDFCYPIFSELVLGAICYPPPFRSTTYSNLWFRRTALYAVVISFKEETERQRDGDRRLCSAAGPGRRGDPESPGFCAGAAGFIIFLGSLVKRYPFSPRNKKKNYRSQKKIQKMVKFSAWFFLRRFFRSRFWAIFARMLDGCVCFDFGFSFFSSCCFLFI